MKILLGSLELEVKLDPRWITVFDLEWWTWGEDWKYEDVGAGALFGPVMLRTVLRQSPSSIRVIDVLGTLCEVARAVLEDKDPLEERVETFEDFCQVYGGDIEPLDPKAIERFDRWVAGETTQFFRRLSPEETLRMSPEALKSLYGTSDREELERILRGRSEGEKIFPTRFNTEDDDAKKPS